MFAETIVFPQAREYTKRTTIITFYMEENTMDKFIPIDKQSKKMQKEFYAKQRGTWGTFNPVTRTVPNGKAYNRNKLKQEDRRSGRLSYGKQDSLPLFVWLSIEVACENCPTSDSLYLHLLLDTTV